MKNKVQCWRLYQQANKFGSRPSAILGVEHPILSYFIDDAVEYFGGWVEGKLNERDKKTGKPKHKLEKLLGAKKHAEKLRMSEVAVMFGIPHPPAPSPTRGEGGKKQFNNNA